MTFRFTDWTTGFNRFSIYRPNAKFSIYLRLDAGKCPSRLWRSLLMIELKSLKYHLKRSVRVSTALGMVFLFLWKSHQVENPAKSDPERTKPCPAKISTSARNCCPEVETLKHDFGEIDILMRF